MSLFNRIPAKKESDKTIISFDIVTLRESGMRCTAEYEIVVKDGKAEVSQYSIRYSKDKDQRILKKRAECSIDDVLKLFNDCRLLSWNGFDGPHPRGVCDGIMTTFKASVNDGKKIYASGSQNFPRHYRDFTNGLYNLLANRKGNE